MASTPCKRGVGGSAHRRSPCAGKLAHQRTRLAVAERLAEVRGGVPTAGSLRILRSTS